MNQRTAKTNHARACAAALLAAVIGACGCSRVPSVYPSDASRPLPEAATTAPLNVDIDTLAAALPLTFDALHWGTIRVVNEVTALHAHALTEDDRPVEFRAQQARDGLSVQVRVGYFGDPRQEQRLLDELPRQIDAWRRWQKHRAGGVR